MTPLIHGERDPYLSCPPVVQVPDGMTADEARQILADHRPWVEVDPEGERPKGARVRHEWRYGVFGTFRSYIHPDDAPGSDSDLIDDLATALRKAWDANAGLARYPVSDPVWGDLARVAIERVRAEA